MFLSELSQSSIRALPRTSAKLSQAFQSSLKALSDHPKMLLMAVSKLHQNSCRALSKRFRNSAITPSEPPQGSFRAPPQISLRLPSELFQKFHLYNMILYYRGYFKYIIFKYIIFKKHETRPFFSNKSSAGNNISFFKT